MLKTQKLSFLNPIYVFFNNFLKKEKKVIKKENNFSKVETEFYTKIQKSLEKIKIQFEDSDFVYDLDSYRTSEKNLFFVLIHAKNKNHKRELFTIDCCITGKISFYTTKAEYLIEMKDPMVKIIKEETE